MEEDIEWENEHPLGELRRFQAYETSLIVSYARPFSQSKGHIPRLSYAKLGIKLSAFTREIHKDLIAKRNKVFAHSDASAVEYLPPFVMRGQRDDGAIYSTLGPPKFREGTFFGQADIARIRVLVDCLHSAVFFMANAMHPNFIDRLHVHDMQEIIKPRKKD